jgi:N-acetylmuramoyl-L-alanine amidase
MGLGAMSIAAIPTTPAIAYEFAEATVDANEFVLVAAPIGDRAHQLLILRQLTNERPCWSTSGGMVDPLLLSFDFTGICGRSTDSNGYSLRMSGQDLGMDYSLRVVPSGNSLVLMAISDRSGSRIPIGQTDSITNGFAEIYLYPGWYISQRSYEGQPLGHFYITHQQDLNSFIAASPQPSLSLNIAPQRPSSTPDSVPTPSTLQPQQPSSSLSTQPQPLTPAPLTSSGVSLSTTQSTPIDPTETTTAPVDSNEGWIEFTPPTTAAPPQSPPNLPAPSNLVVVPNVLPPTGQQIAPATPSVSTSRASQLGFSYRVIVDTSTPQQEAEVRSLVPDAFRTQLGSRTVMQAGLFETQAEATQLQQQLVQRGLNASILSVE